MGTAQDYQNMLNQKLGTLRKKGHATSLDELREKYKKLRGK